MPARIRAVALAAVVAAACGPNKPSKDEQKLDRCAAEIESLARLAAADPAGQRPLSSRDDVIQRLARSCEPVYPLCQLQFQDVVNGRLEPARLAQRCLAQYCPVLPAPRPSLCESGATPTPQAIDDAAAAVLRYEWGEAAASRLRGRVSVLRAGLHTTMTRLASEPITVTPADIPPPAVAPSLLVIKEGIWIGAPGAAPVFVPRCRDGHDLLAVADALCAVSSRVAPTAVELAAGDVPYAEVVAVIDLAIAEGRRDLAMSDPNGLSTKFPDRPPDAAQPPGACRTDRGRCPPAPPPPDPAQPVIAGAGPMTGVDLSKAPVVTITADRKVLLGSTAISDQLDGDRLRDLYERLSQRTTGKDQGVIVLQADRSLPYDVIVRVIKTAQAAGWPNVQFAGGDAE